MFRWEKTGQMFMHAKLLVRDFQVGGGNWSNVYACKIAGTGDICNEILSDPHNHCKDMYTYIVQAVLIIGVVS